MSKAKKQHLCVLEKAQKPEGDGPYSIRIGEDIIFDADVLEALAQDGCLPVHYDLLVLCAAIEFADRHWKRPHGWSRTLQVTVPVIELETWQSAEATGTLAHTLRFLTGDSWNFNFVQAKNIKPCHWRQIPLNFGEIKTFAIAYSEGLDSRAVSALSGDTNENLCIRVANRHQKPQHGDNFFTQIPFTVKNRGGRESSFRSRGFQFAAITAIAAHIRNISRIVVPESGQGALGPAMLPLHRLYADYRNHPAFFRKIELFIKQLLGHQVYFDQPRLWFTKGETLLAFTQLPNKTITDLTNTRSCWQTRHVVNVGGRRRQCGLCAACLLRRFSLHAAGIEELPDTYVIKDLKVADVYEAMSAILGKSDQDNMIGYGIAGARHFQHLADMSLWTDKELHVFTSEIAAAISLTEAETLTKLRTLLSAHAKEWHAFLAAQGELSFLQNWMGGGN
jgi:hypothetical protein